MRFIGVDLAWTQMNETGLVSFDRDGTISDAGWTIGTSSTVAWIEKNATPDTLVFVDAPLIVTNPPKTQRLCENQTSKRYGRWKAGANSTNVAKPERLGGVYLRLELERIGFRYEDGIDGPPSGGRVVSECYPYATTVGALELGYPIERPAYKRPPRGVTLAAFRPRRARVCDELIARVADLAAADPPVDLRSHPVTRQLLDEPSPLVDRDYKHREDLPMPSSVRGPLPFGGVGEWNAARCSETRLACNVRQPQSSRPPGPSSAAQARAAAVHDAGARS